MKKASTLFLSMLGTFGLFSLPANASPTLYISNQTGFDKPLVYVWGYDADQNYKDFGYNGYSEGTVDKYDLTFDKFTISDDAVGMDVNVQYSNNWSRGKADYPLTMEDKDYYIIANADGLTAYTEGGVNVYKMLYVNIDELPFKMNTGYDIDLYAVASDGTEPFGEMPGKHYKGCTDIVDGKGYFIYAFPCIDKAYTLTFTEEANNYKVTTDFQVTPTKDIFLKLVGLDNVTQIDNPLTPPEETESILAYTFDETAKRATVIGFVNPEADAENLVIPSTLTVDGVEYIVSAIKDNAFSGMKNITGTLTLGDNLEVIGDNAFNGCQNITGGLVFGDKVSTIGTSAFSACIGLNGTLKFGNALQSIGKNAFILCSGLTGGLDFPAGLTTIGEGAFNGCKKLDGDIKFGSGLTSIGKQAFMGASSLKGSLTIPNSVSTIGEGAFMSCSSLDGQLTLPDNLTKIAPNTFFGCTSLSGTLAIPSSVTVVGDGAFYNCSSLSGTLTIPENVTTIGKKAFTQCSQITGLELGNSVTVIDESAFQLCGKLWGWLTLPASLQTIGASAFANCDKLTGPLTIPDNVESIGSMAFAMCEGFKGALTIGKNVTTIGDQAFVSCSGFTGKLTIPEGVTTIGFRTFGWCWNLTELELPSTLKSLGNVAFLSCWNLKSINCKAVTPPTITEGENAFTSDNYSGTTLYVPSEGYYAYKEAYEWKDFLNILWTGDEPSGIEDIMNEQDGKATYYNLQGMRVENPEEGQILIKKTSEGIRKIIYSNN